MTVRKKEGKHAKSAPRSIRELIRSARATGHDTLGIMNDPETLGHLEFTVLVRKLTERFAAAFEKPIAPDATGAGAVVSASIAQAIGAFMWEPVATCVVRAMIRKLCEGTQAVGDDVTYNDSGLYAIARDALHSVESRLGDDWIWVVNGRFNRVAGVAADVFMEAERFVQPTQFTCRNLPYTFHHKDDVLNVSRGDA